MTERESFYVNKVVHDAIELWGVEKQSIVAIEELSELQKELCKALRGNLNRDHLIEEMADVTLMLTQIIIMYDLEADGISEGVLQKVNRLEQRLKELGK